MPLGAIPTWQILTIYLVFFALSLFVFNYLDWEKLVKKRDKNQMTVIVVYMFFSLIAASCLGTMFIFLTLV